MSLEATMALRSDFVPTEVSEGNNLYCLGNL